MIFSLDLDVICLGAMDIGKRITSSLLNTVFRAVINFCTALLLARLLGPEDFGRFSFLIATFIALKQFFDLASSEAFFKFVSERTRSKKFLKIYSGWILTQFSVVLLFIGILFPESFLQKFWVGEQKITVILALMAMFFRETIWANIANLSESYRLTTYNQNLQTIVVLGHLAILALLWEFGSLVIEVVFAVSVLEWMFASILLFKIINKHQLPSQQTSAKESEINFADDTVRSVFGEFWKYCKFLIPYAWLGVVVDFSSRWMLQTWGSAEDQAYFAVGQQFAAISILIASSVLKVFWKEVAEAHHQNDFQRMEMLYTKSSSFLYFIASILAAMLVPWTQEIIDILLGDAYTGAFSTMQIMFVYPVHQTIGIITGTLLYATGHIKLQVTLGLFFSVAALVSSFWLMAPDTIWDHGLDLGSEGLAIRFVLVNLVFANVWAFMISRLFDWQFKWLYQLTTLGFTLACSYAVKMGVIALLHWPTLVSMFISTILYLAIILYVVYRYPTISGFTRSEILEFVSKIIIKRG